jgi:hypothetical protein
MVFLDLGLMLPFFFVLAIVYGSLEVSGVFRNRGVKGIVAVVVAFFSISSPAVVGFVNFLLPYAAMFFIAFFFLGLLFSFFRGKGEGKKDGGNFALLAVILALALIFLSNQENLRIISLGDRNFVGMAALLVIVLVLYSAYQAGEK